MTYFAYDVSMFSFDLKTNSFSKSYRKQTSSLNEETKHDWRMAENARMSYGLHAAPDVAITA